MSAQGKEILVDEKQRDAERSALRNVRGALDSIESQQSRQRATVKRVLVIVAVVALAAAAYLSTFLVR